MLYKFNCYDDTISTSVLLIHSEWNLLRYVFKSHGKVEIFMFATIQFAKCRDCYTSHMICTRDTGISGGARQKCLGWPPSRHQNKKIETHPLFDRNLSCDIMAFDIAAFVSNCDSGCINNI
jgi:hypothetical protein